MSRWRIIAAAATAVAGGMALLGAASPPDSPRSQEVVLTGNGGPGPQGVVISGTPLRNLYPGAVRRIQVSVANPHRFSITVYSVRGELTGTSRRSCLASRTNLQVRGYHGHLPYRLLPGQRRSTGYVEVRMPGSVAEACQNTAFAIRLTGKATRSNR